MKLFREIIQKKYQQTIGVVMANDGDVIAVVTQAIKLKIANFILYGPQEQIKGILRKYRFNKVEIVNCADSEKCLIAISRDIKISKIDLIMKGSIKMQLIIEMFLDKSHNFLASGQLLSHVSILKFDHYHKLLFLTDCAINSKPNFTQKVQIINNALSLIDSLNFKIPKIALIAASDNIEERFSWANEAFQIANLPSQTWKFACKINGPIKIEAALKKNGSMSENLSDNFGGDVDLIVMENLESANILYKSLVYFVDALTMGLVVGGKIPIVIFSFVDDIQNTLFSIALGLWFLNHQRQFPKFQKENERIF